MNKGQQGESQTTAIVKATNEIESALERCTADKLRALPALSQAVELASGMATLQRVMTNDLVNRVFMPLQGSPLGFVTDRDSAREGPRYYPPEVVRDCVIEAMIKGLRPVGNEFNIIAGRMYAAKAGVVRLVKEFPGLTDLRIQFGVPAMKDGGALVAARAAWNLNGKPMVLNRDVEKRSDGTHFDGRIAVRVNKMMGADAILGKASRKLHHAIYEMLTGCTFTLSDGEVIDTVGETVTVRQEFDTSAPELPAQDGQRVQLPGNGKKTNGKGKAPPKRDSRPQASQTIDPETGEVHEAPLPPSAMDERIYQDEPGANG